MIVGEEVLEFNFSIPTCQVDPELTPPKKKLSPNLMEEFSK